MPLPQITVVGNLTADPDLKFAKDGSARLSFRVACNDRRKNPTTNEWEDGDTTYVSVTVWRALAEALAETLQKGSPVVVLGRLKSRTVETDNGKREYFDVEATTVSQEFKPVRGYNGGYSTTSTNVPDAYRNSTTTTTTAAALGDADPWA